MEGLELPHLKTLSLNITQKKSIKLWGLHRDPEKAEENGHVSTEPLIIDELYLLT